MTTALIIATAAATIAWLLARHHAADLAAQRDDLAAENDDLRGEVRCWKATAALNERAAHMLAEDNERLRVEAETSLPRAPWPGEPLRDAPPGFHEVTRASMDEFLADERALREKYAPKRPRKPSIKAVK